MLLSNVIFFRIGNHWIFCHFDLKSLSFLCYVLYAYLHTIFSNKMFFFIAFHLSIVSQTLSSNKKSVLEELWISWSVFQVPCTLCLYMLNDINMPQVMSFVFLFLLIMRIQCYVIVMLYNCMNIFMTFVVKWTLLHYFIMATCNFILKCTLDVVIYVLNTFVKNSHISSYLKFLVLKSFSIKERSIKE